MNRWSDRLGSIVSMALLGGLAAASYLLSEWALQPDWQRASADRAGPTALVYGATIVRTNRDGLPDQRIQTPEIEQFADGQSLFKSPVVVILRPDRPPVTVTADKGSVSADQSLVTLRQKVVVTRRAFGTDPSIRVETESLAFFVNEDIARTADPVMIYRGTSTLYGVGMTLNQKTDQMTILADSRMVLPRQK
ncbi:MAG: LPS export ABC transporter periplasmic protein LptC [Proteobacteria bacterium]|nr:LPS export ABC transporter periplasmic protein LptC [Pseudomonadota bacterium]MDA0846792.1 LPS export ABC transporter periplasmic protein LptC [Pseudomonadota bacterium]